MNFLSKKTDSRKPYFLNVAIATLLSGAVILALGLVELGLNVFASGTFVSPTQKIIGGLVVLSLGYIHMELEMMRVKK